MGSRHSVHRSHQLAQPMLALVLLYNSTGHFCNSPLLLSSVCVAQPQWRSCAGRPRAMRLIRSASTSSCCFHGATSCGCLHGSLSVQYAFSSLCLDGFSFGAVALLAVPADGAWLSSLSLLLSTHRAGSPFTLSWWDGVGWLWGGKLPGSWKCLALFRLP